jgi:uncharacterized protein
VKGFKHFLIFCLLITSNFIQAEAPASTTLNTAYGTLEISSPLIQELIDSKGFQRLKDIHQYGIANNLKPTEHYTRFHHSIGVYYLLNKFNVSEEEQIAGLLHDASHTVFSHVGDYLYSSQGDDSYQDQVHDWHLSKTDIGEILNKHGYNVNQINPKQEKFIALENSLPNLCADRIEYNLQGGWLHGLISHEEMLSIVDSLRYEDQTWFFTDANNAQKFAQISLYLTVHQWGSDWNIITYQWCAEALKRALDLNLLTSDDIHFSTDQQVWQVLVQAEDQEINSLVNQMRHYSQQYESTSFDKAETIIKGKFRGVDPLVKTKSGLQHLTQINTTYKQEFFAIKDQMEKGWPIKFTYLKDAIACNF